jgi:TPR repeat protein
VGDLAANMFGLLNRVDQPRLAQLLANLGPDDAAFLLQMKRLLSERKGQPVSDATWPAFEEHWDKVPRRYLEAGLNHFLPQVQFLTNSQALYERGLMLISPGGAFQDFDEAAQCFRKAADQGHAGAQLQLGVLCETGQGVPQNFHEAMFWYRRAATNEELHANCRIAALYHYGKGVPEDLDEAARLYRVEAGKDCFPSQFNLAVLLEGKGGIEEALPWYRRAAEGGVREAQAKMGGILSDNLFGKPDYVEACMWFTLAADGGDKVSATLLRRVKSKLTYAQLVEANERAAEITKRLEEKQKKQRSKQ